MLLQRSKTLYSPNQVVFKSPDAIQVHISTNLRSEEYEIFHLRSV